MRDLRLPNPQPFFSVDKPEIFVYYCYILDYWCGHSMMGKMFERIGDSEVWACRDESMIMRFDWQRYRDFYATRTIEDAPRDDRRIHNHPLEGKAFQFQDGSRVVIETVHSHWYFGYYETAVYRLLGTRSHGTQVVANHSSRSETIVDNYADFLAATEIINDEQPTTP